MAGGVSIGDSAFYECLQLSELALPATLTTIGNRAFAYTGLKALALPAGVQRVGDDAFENVPLESLDLGSVVEIGNNAFRNVAVAEVTVPQSVLSVGDRAFAAYNGGLRRITFLGAPTLGAAVFNRYGGAA
jgi:hypothetical protein